MPECPRCGLPFLVVEVPQEELDETIGSDVQIDVNDKPDGSINGMRLVAALFSHRLISSN